MELEARYISCRNGGVYWEFRFDDTALNLGNGQHAMRILVKFYTRGGKENLEGRGARTPHEKYFEIPFDIISNSQLSAKILPCIS